MSPSSDSISVTAVGPEAEVTTISNFSADQILSPYRRYHVRSRYEFDSGCVVMSPANNSLSADTEGGMNGESEDSDTNQGSIVLQVAAPSARRVVTFDMIRAGSPCEAPDATPLDGEVLLSAVVESSAPLPSADANSMLWGMSGKYIYAATTPESDYSPAASPPAY